MVTVLTALGMVSAAIWIIILLLPWRPWSTREYLDARADANEEDLGDITALIPARNEADFIGTTLRALKTQGHNIKVVVVDDQSSDNTAEMARNSFGKGIHIVKGRPLPEGWFGKLWALEQGRAYIKTPLTLLMDADIELRPGILPALRQKMKQEQIHMVSLMAQLPMARFWERVLIPAFIYFFKLLYPFRHSNSPGSRTAAAAGGCILLKTAVLNKMGGFESIRNQLIDDCALAKRIKGMGYRTWIGLTHSVRSLRAYSSLKEIWAMVSRSAFTQLRHSIFLLILCTLALMAAFWLPFICLVMGPMTGRLLAVITLAAMFISYLPTLRFYRIPAWWGLMLPLSGTLYLAMTWTSAVQYFMGSRSRWKGRAYGRKGEYM